MSRSRKAILEIDRNNTGRPVVHICPTCNSRVPFRFTTDGNGRLIEKRDPCDCERAVA